MGRMRSKQTVPEDEFINDIQEEIFKKGVKNAVCIILGDNDEITNIVAHTDSVQIAGILDLGKTVYHNEVLEPND